MLLHISDSTSITPLPRVPTVSHCNVEIPMTRLLRCRVELRFYKKPSRLDLGVLREHNLKYHINMIIFIPLRKKHTFSQVQILIVYLVS